MVCHEQLKLTRRNGAFICRDKHGKPMTHPDYDPKTLLVCDFSHILSLVVIFMLITNIILLLFQVPASFLSSKEATPVCILWLILIIVDQYYCLMHA